MDWIRYANQGATRNQPLSPDLAQSLAFLQDMGIQAEVFSGGQPTEGGGPRVGSVRHDEGNAADVFFYQNGRRLDWNNPEDLPLFQEIVRRGRESGLTGFGAGEGYMLPGSMHIGFGEPAVWGAEGRGANAPEWLRSAYYGSGSDNTRSETMNQPMQPQQMPQQEQPRGLRGLLSDPDLLDRLVIGFGGMTLNPNTQLMQMAADRIAGRREERQTTESRNRTAEWLRSQGRDDLADAVMSGALGGREAASLAYQPARAPIEIDGRLVDPQTFEVLYESPGSGGLNQESFNQLNVLRDDLRNELASFEIVRQGYNNIISFYNNPGATSDYALAVAFAKILDPGSVAREGEVAAVQNAGAQIPALGQALRNAVTGEGSLTPQVRQEIAELATQKYTERASGAQKVVSRYTDIAGRYGLPTDLLFTGEIPEPAQVVPAVVPDSVAAKGVTQEDWDLLTQEERQEFLEN